MRLWFPPIDEWRLQLVQKDVIAHAHWPKRETKYVVRQLKPCVLAALEFISFGVCQSFGNAGYLMNE